MRNGVMAPFLLLTCLGPLVTPLDAQANHLARYREARYVMGTILEITLHHGDVKEARRSLDEAFSLAQKLDELLSNYKSQSEVNRLNQKAGKGRVKVSPELYDFLALTKSLSRKTEGAFDMTVGPLIHLWREAHERGKLPPSASLRTAQSLVGYQQVVLRSGLEVELSQRGMTIDTGGIGKGYAVDQMATLFKRSGIKSALINFGQSSLYAIGSPPHAHAWTLLLQFPEQRPLGILEIKDRALSASDSLGRFFEIAGRKYGHLIDPSRGIPITERVQALVLARLATEAEALSKYAILRGWKEGQEAKAWGTVQIMRIDQSGAIQRSRDFPLISQIAHGHSGP